MARLPDKLDFEIDRARVKGEGGQVGGLPDDEIIGLQSALDQLQGSDAALKLAADEGDRDVTLKPRAALDQLTDRAQVRGGASLHVRAAQAKDEFFRAQTAPGIDRPSQGRRIGIDMAVEQQAPAASRAAPPSDGVEAAISDRLELGLETEMRHGLRQVASERRFPRRRADAVDANDRAKRVETCLFVDLHACHRKSLALGDRWRERGLGPRSPASRPAALSQCSTLPTFPWAVT